MLSFPPTNAHQAQAERTGDYVKYTCPLCPGWWRIVNLKTGETQASKPKQGEAAHVGTITAAGLDYEHGPSAS